MPHSFKVIEGGADETVKKKLEQQERRTAGSGFDLSRKQFPGKKLVLFESCLEYFKFQEGNITPESVTTCCISA